MMLAKTAAQSRAVRPGDGMPSSAPAVSFTYGQTTLHACLPASACLDMCRHVDVDVDMDMDMDTAARQPERACASPGVRAAWGTETHRIDSAPAFKFN